MNPHAHWRQWLLITSAISLAVLALIFSPIHQSGNFYAYADQRAYLSIPNFWNVITNLPFLWVGWLGIMTASRRNASNTPERYKGYTLFYWGLIGTFVGSSLYHLVPGPFTLMLDRIPITISFISLYCVVLTEYISPTIGKKLLLPLLAYGVISVGYWYITDLGPEKGNMAAYVLVQVIPIVHLPLILWCYSDRYGHSRLYALALILYLLAKWAESSDEILYDLLGFSGHSLKHLFAALGGYCIYLNWRPKLQ
ncbi:membrane protein [Photobacterium aquae]|uniref:Membrane protein n=1 Tax=Photobacterium aquae TaxID=1195763 RepID=A0A0J1H5M5_9GAMM|nr:ceramidase domain-containing protein [Photobacterium aquae]KLV07001.1 membrane protein [Photobacterium aquae]